MSTTNKPIVILNSSENWDEWYHIIKSRAQRADIFHFIDPITEIKPPQPQEPVAPSRGTGDDVYETYRLQLDEYRIRIKKHEKQRREINNIATIIEDSIAEPLQPLLRQANDPNPYSILRTLQGNMKPADHTTEAILLGQLAQLSKPPTHQNLDKWIAQ
ncbi:hypothetical protein GTA08_BOTSDO00003 [Botryosphaeria dothidea]|uniref:Uncharacterized protein n=1 Tax=Botryosphaeria dothidea TaxID=55169 RepID=A0A8H4NCT4_9PEZI|nr:hypothetical protein GTA08_BOTSDO00003 [Botryosphaeria dothidea]